MIEAMKKTLTFHDENWDKAIVKIEITHRNWYPELTMSAEFKWHGWQCLDYIVPDNEYQKELIELWESNHLKEVDEWILITLEHCISFIESIEDDTYSDPININDMGLSVDRIVIAKANDLSVEVDRLLALIDITDLSIESLDDVEYDSNRKEFSAEWNDWAIVTDDEADDMHYDYVENLIDDIGIAQLNSWGPYIRQSDDWTITVSQEVIFSPSERWEALNPYDGNEYESHINWEYWFGYQR